MFLQVLLATALPLLTNAQMLTRTQTSFVGDRAVLCSLSINGPASPCGPGTTCKMCPWKEVTLCLNDELYEKLECGKTVEELEAPATTCRAAMKTCGKSIIPWATGGYTGEPCCSELSCM